MAAYVIEIENSFGHLGPYLSRDAATAELRPGETLTEVHGYVITRRADAETLHTGPYADIGSALDALTLMTTWDAETYGPDWAVYELTHH